eukprot:GFUD01013246.1.p1 GENE.GFUD01013246.1~~GFUD01013246.1.p1  ORF type:complete len:151 (+),score=46.18 GFUD01013246.1:136-588(+)
MSKKRQVEEALTGPTVTTICGGQTFEAPCSLFSQAPVLRDCFAFCEEDSSILDLDPLFFLPRGVEDQEAAAVFQELLKYLANNPDEFPSHFSFPSSMALTKDKAKHRLTPGFPYPATLLALADYLAMEPLKKLCMVNVHFLPDEKGSKRV